MKIIRFFQRLNPTLLELILNSQHIIPLMECIIKYDMAIHNKISTTVFGILNFLLTSHTYSTIDTIRQCNVKSQMDALYVIFFKYQNSIIDKNVKLCKYIALNYDRFHYPLVLDCNTSCQIIENSDQTTQLKLLTNRIF